MILVLFALSVHGLIIWWDPFYFSHYRCAMWCHSGKLGQKWELKLRLVEILRAYFKSWMHYRPWTDVQVNYTHENAGRKKLSVWLVIFMVILNDLPLYLAAMRWVITLTVMNKISRALCSRQPSLNADMDLSPPLRFANSEGFLSNSFF